MIKHSFPNACRHGEPSCRHYFKNTKTTMVLRVKNIREKKVSVGYPAYTLVLQRLDPKGPLPVEPTGHVISDDFIFIYTPHSASSVFSFPNVLQYLIAPSPTSMKVCRKHGLDMTMLSQALELFLWTGFSTGARVAHMD
jgi:hypothetical protein